MKNVIAIATMATCVAMTGAARAAGDHKGHDHGSSKPAAAHADDAKPAKGGVVTVVKDMSYELVVQSGTVSLYVSDHGKPVDLKGASAKLTLLTAANKLEVPLSAAGDRLEAKGSFNPAAGTKALAVVTAGGATTTVRFTLK